MTANTTPDGADERVRAFIDRWTAPDWLGRNDLQRIDDHELTIADLRALLDERERLHKDWMRQAAQLNRIAAIAGHALILRVCDDTTPEEIRIAFARAVEDVHAVVTEPDGDAEQRAERFRAVCAGLINDATERERDAAMARAEQAEAELETVRGQLLAEREAWREGSVARLEQQTGKKITIVLAPKDQCTATIDTWGVRCEKIGGHPELHYARTDGGHVEWRGLDDARQDEAGRGGEENGTGTEGDGDE